MTSVSKGTTCGQIFYDFYWGSGFLPSRFQGVKFRGSGDPVLYLSNPDGMTRAMRRGLLDDIAKLNEMKLHDFGDPEIATRDRAVRDGLQDAGERPRADRPLERAGRGPRRCTARRSASRAPSPTTA